MFEFLNDAKPLTLEDALAGQDDSQKDASRTGQQDVNQQAERHRQQEQQNEPGRGQGEPSQGGQRDLGQQKVENHERPGSDKGQIRR